jgi:hypothetical protein
MSKLLKLSVGLLSAVLFAAESPWVGTWKLDSANSTKSAAPKASKEATITIRELGDRIIEVAFKGTRNDGTPISGKYTVSLDGGPNTYLEGSPPAGISATTKKINERNSVITTRRDGKEIRVNHVVLGEDGKTFTANTKGLDDEGKPFNGVEVYSKQ